MIEGDIIYSVLTFDSDDPTLFKFCVEDASSNENILCSLETDKELMFYLDFNSCAPTPIQAWDNYKKELVDQVKELEEQIADVNLEILELAERESNGN